MNTQLQIKIKEYQAKHTARLMSSTFVDWHQMAELATRAMGKFSCYIANNIDYGDPVDDKVWEFVIERIQAIYGFKTPKYYEYMGGIVHGGLFFFDSEYEMLEFYHIFDAELTDSSAIFACTYCPIRGGLTENT